MSKYIKLDDMRAIFCQSNSLTQAWSGFDRLPSIDIVFCKECKHSPKNTKEIPLHDSCYTFKPDDFCSYGQEGDENVETELMLKVADRKTEPQTEICLYCEHYEPKGYCELKENSVSPNHNCDEYIVIKPYKVEIISKSYERVYGVKAIVEDEPQTDYERGYQDGIKDEIDKHHIGR